MIYTITLNPAIDKTIIIDKYKRNQVNRIKNSRKDVGGKGINVSKVLNELSVESTCTGILGDENANFFLDYLNKLNIQSNFHIISGENRTNIKIVEEKYNTITDINDKGFEVEKDEIEGFFNHLLSLVKEGDIVILSGSLPKGIEDTIYKRIIENLKQKSIKVILDADGPPLLKGVEAIPYAIKPNLHELKAIVDVDESNIYSLLEGGKHLVDKGIEKVLISLGDKGAIYITKENAYISKGIKVPVKSTVGAGDAMVAGMVYGIENNLEDEQIFKLAIACGTVKVMTEGTKIPSVNKIKSISKDIIIEYLR